MTEQRHPDIEIYLKDCSVSDIENWLKSISETFFCSFTQGTTHEYSITMNGHTVPVMLHEKVAGKAWSSVWFKSDKTPWAIDIDCARVASAQLDKQVRCIASGWQTGDDPDEWWKVEKGSETLIQWITA